MGFWGIYTPKDPLYASLPSYGAPSLPYSFDLVQTVRSEAFFSPAQLLGPFLCLYEFSDCLPFLLSAPPVLLFIFSSFLCYCFIFFFFYFFFFTFKHTYMCATLFRVFYYIFLVYYYCFLSF